MAVVVLSGSTNNQRRKSRGSRSHPLISYGGMDLTQTSQRIWNRASMRATEDSEGERSFGGKDGMSCEGGPSHPWRFRSTRLRPFVRLPQSTYLTGSFADIALDANSYEKEGKSCLEMILTTMLQRSKGTQNHPKRPCYTTTDSQP